MTFSDFKKFLKDMVKECLGGNVIWAEQYITQIPPPCTTLKLKDTGFPIHPVSIIKDGEIYSYYDCRKILEINRYTAGVSEGAGIVTGMEDTSVEDLTILLLWLQSDKGIERMHQANACILQMGGVRNLTALEGVRYKNRAMLELTVNCTLEYHEGEAAIYAPGVGTPPESGPTGYFEDVEMEARYE